MKLHQILAIATAGTFTIILLGLSGVACGLETPRVIFDIMPNALAVLAGSTVVSWVIGTIARAVL